jgi:hypothetical protein
MFSELIDFWYTTMEGKYLSKQAHFAANFMLVTIVGHFFMSGIALIAGITAAIAKEIIDKLTGRGCPQISAALVSIAGALLAWGIM